jgi:hypothetical protein
MRSLAARSLAAIHVAERNAASVPSMGRRGRAGGWRALAFPLCNPVCPVAGNGFIVAAAACCGQTIGGALSCANQIGCRLGSFRRFGRTDPAPLGRSWLAPSVADMAPSIACTRTAR